MAVASIIPKSSAVAVMIVIPYSLSGPDAPGRQSIDVMRAVSAANRNGTGMINPMIVQIRWPETPAASNQTCALAWNERTNEKGLTRVGVARLNQV
jgi:hypothetical protein